MPIHFDPIDPPFLASSPQGVVPVTAHLGAEDGETADVGGYGVVREVPSQHVREPSSLHGDRQVLSDTDFVFDSLQLGTLSFGDGMTHEDKTSLLAQAAYVGEPKELEGLGLTLSVAFPFLDREASETDEPGLVGMKLEFELFQPLSQMRQEPFRVLLVLEADNKIVGITHHDDFSAAGLFSFPLHPQVQHIVQLHVGEQGRDHGPLRSAFLTGFPSIAVHDSGLEPLGDQAQESIVSNPVLDHFHQPRVIDGIEVRADVGVEHPVHFLAAEGRGQRIERLMRRPAGPEPIGEPEKVPFIDGIEHFDDGALDDLVFQCRHAERSLPSIGFWNENPARGLGPVSPSFCSRVSNPTSYCCQLIPSTPGDARRCNRSKAARSRATSRRWNRQVNRAFLSDFAFRLTRSNALSASFVQL